MPSEERDNVDMQVEGKQVCVAINREWVVMSAMCMVAKYMTPQEMEAICILHQ